MSEANNNAVEPNNEDADRNDGEDNEVSKAKKLFDEMVYCFSSFHAIITPVSLCMILSALAVVFINTEETRAAGEAAFASTYEVVDLDEGNSSQNFVASVANTLIIVSVICVMTFVVVLLYKYRCMKFFLGYMIFVTAILLGYLTSNMWMIAIEKYGWKVDKFSFAFIMYNYAVVGTVAIFWPRGIPKWASQGYLIASAVVLAWQLSFFGEWTAWTLLVVLALYDLFAVLTPCGPLKALASLMSKPGAPVLPGLLYEASLPNGVQKPNKRNGDDQDDGRESRDETASDAPENTTPPTQQSAESVSQPVFHDTSTVEHTRVHRNLPPPMPEPGPEPEQEPTVSAIVTQSASGGEGEIEAMHRDRQPLHAYASANNTQSSARLQAEPATTRTEFPAVDGDSESMNIGKVPLAIAKLYKLNVIDEDGVLRRGSRKQSTWQRNYSPDEIRAIEWTPKQLRKEITAIFPARGGRIEKSEESNPSVDEGPRYRVYNRQGDLLRTFVVNRQGQVMQVVKRDRSDDGALDNTIKLGLGDFIFYSVLVSKAALYSFTSFAACMVVILFGLMATLVLLAMHGKALPALPISIFLGVATFFLTRYFTEPWIQEILRLPFYV